MISRRELLLASLGAPIVPYTSVFAQGGATALLRDARPKGAWLWFYFQGPELDELRKVPAVAALLADVDPRRAR